MLFLLWLGWVSKVFAKLSQKVNCWNRIAFFFCQIWFPSKLLHYVCLIYCDWRFLFLHSRCLFRVSGNYCRGCSWQRPYVKLSTGNKPFIELGFQLAHHQRFLSSLWVITVSCLGFVFNCIIWFINRYFDSCKQVPFWKGAQMSNWDLMRYFGLNLSSVSELN